MRKELISNRARRALTEAILRSSGKECTTAEEVLDNLSCLTTTLEKFGEEVKFLPLTRKKMVCTMLDAGYRIEYTVNKVAGEWCEVVAHFYWSDDEKPAGEGYIKKWIQQIMPMHTMTGPERDALLEATCRGLAASRAITDAGIGAEFYADFDDADIPNAELSEHEEKLDSKASDKVPTIPSATEKKKTSAKKESIPKTTAQTVSPASTLSPIEEAINAATSIPESVVATMETATVPAKENPVEAPPSSISIEEARVVIADVGTCKGNTLGDIYDKQPRNLVWLVNNGAACAEYARILVMQNNELASKLK